MNEIITELASYFQANIKNELRQPYQSRSYTGQVKTIGGTPAPATPKYASGLLYNSVQVKTEETPDGLAMVLDFGAAASYAYFVEYGRKNNNRFPPLGIIDRWIIQKGISGIRDKQGRFIKRKGIRFLIARSIAKHGIYGIGFVDAALEKSMERIVDKYGEIAELQVLEYLRNTGLFVEYGTEADNNLTRTRII